MEKTTRRSFLLSSAVGVAGLAEAAAAPAIDGPATSAQPTYRLTREIPAEEGFDLVVADGGPAGTAAAVCAARLGGWARRYCSWKPPAAWAAWAPRAWSPRSIRWPTANGCWSAA